MKSRKLLSVLLALVLVFSICAVAYATYPQTSTGTVTVRFTTGCSSNTNGTNYWLGYSANANTLLPGGSVDIAVDLANCPKTYVPTGVTNPMGSTPSVLDAIIASQSSYDYDLGWDSSPYVGDPGAYVHNVEDQELESNYEEGNGVHHSWGTGFVVIIEYTDSTGNVTSRVFPSEYVSNVPVADGMIIYVDLSSYDYTW